MFGPLRGSDLQADIAQRAGPSRNAADPRGGAAPPNTLLELRRDMARLRFVMDQIKEVEETRAQELNRLLRTRRMSWFVSSRALWALALRQRTCWSMRFLPGPGVIDEPSPAMRASPAPPTRAAAGGARKGSPRQATPASAAG